MQSTHYVDHKSGGALPLQVPTHIRMYQSTQMMNEYLCRDKGHTAFNKLGKSDSSQNNSKRKMAE